MEEIIRAAGRVGAKDTVEFRAEVIFAMAKFEGSAMRVGGFVAVGVGEGEAKGAVSAHRESADCPGGMGFKPLGDEVGEFFADGGSVLRAIGGVAVERPATVGHDEEEGKAFDVALDAGSACPNGFVVAKPVEEEHAVVGARSLRDDADCALGFL